MLAQNLAPPPPMVDGTSIVMAAKRKQRQGDTKKKLAAVKIGCRDTGCQDTRCQAKSSSHKALGINMLQTLQPAALNTIRSDGWEEVEMTVDSGASETVLGEEMIATADLKESEGSRRGI